MSRGYGLCIQCLCCGARECLGGEWVGEGMFPFKWRCCQTCTHVYGIWLCLRGRWESVCLCDNIRSPVYPRVLGGCPYAGSLGILICEHTCRCPSHEWEHVGHMWMWACTRLNMDVWEREHEQAAHLLLFSTSRKLQYREDLGWQPGRTRHVCRRRSRIDNMKVIFVYQLKLYRDINKILSHASLIPS